MSAPSPITTHVLDTAKGRPAEGIAIVLERKQGDTFAVVGQGHTDTDGRLRTLLEPGTLTAGTYRIHFDLAPYYGDAAHFFPEASIVFVVTDLAAHYHVPLLLSPFGYSTYRGS